MAFQVALEETPIHKVRTDPTPYRQAIEQGKASGKVVAITLPEAEVKKTVSTLRQVGSAMNVGLRFDNHQNVGNGQVKIRFSVGEKRKFSEAAIAKRKATMKAKGTKAGRKATGAKKATKSTTTARKAS